MTAGTERSLSAPVTFSQQGPPESWERRNRARQTPRVCVNRRTAHVHADASGRVQSGGARPGSGFGPDRVRLDVPVRPGAAGRHQAPPSAPLGG